MYLMYSSFQMGELWHFRLIRLFILIFTQMNKKDMPTIEEAKKDIAETEREIEDLERKALANPRLASWYENMIQERKDFIRKLKEYYGID